MTVVDTVDEDNLRLLGRPTALVAAVMQGTRREAVSHTDRLPRHRPDAG